MQPGLRLGQGCLQFFRPDHRFQQVVFQVCTAALSFRDFVLKICQFFRVMHAAPVQPLGELGGLVAHRFDFEVQIHRVYFVGAQPVFHFLDLGLSLLQRLVLFERLVQFAHAGTDPIDSGVKFLKAVQSGRLTHSSLKLAHGE